MAEFETEIMVWRHSLTDNKREAWNSPTSICNRCPAVRKAIGESKAATGTTTRRTRSKKEIGAAVENAFDVIDDYAHSLEDGDAKAVLAERLGKIATLPVAEPMSFAQQTPQLIELLGQMSRGERLRAISKLAAPFADIMVRGVVGTLELPLPTAGVGKKAATSKRAKTNAEAGTD
jgi:hypothetical protein